MVSLFLIWLYVIYNKKCAYDTIKVYTCSVCIVSDHSTYLLILAHIVDRITVVTFLF